MFLLLVTPSSKSLAKEDYRGIERKIFKVIENNLVEISEEQYRAECKGIANQKMLNEIKNNRILRSVIGIGGHYYRKKYSETSNSEYSAFLKYYALPRKNNTADSTKLTVSSGSSVEAQGSFDFTLSSEIKDTLEGAIGFNFSKKVSHTITRSDEMSVRPGKYGYIYIAGNIYQTKGTYTKHCYSDTTQRHITSKCTSEKINAKIVKSIYVILETSWSKPTYDYMNRL